jgi:hypothetical protein
MTIQKFATSHPRRSKRTLAYIVCVLATIAAGTASAQEELEPTETTEPEAPRAADQPTRFLPGVLVPEAGAARTAGYGWSGYDGAAHAPAGGVAAEVRVSPRLVLGVGAAYAPATDLQPAAVRPSVVARLQLLDQRQHHVDAGVALAFREDRFAAEDGFIQATAMFGVRSTTGVALVNVAYGQDGEGDDREADLRMLTLRRLGRSFHAGVDGHLVKSLWSTDPNRVARGTASYRYSLGPAVTYGIGPLALNLEAGWTAARIARTDSGPFALAGLGAVF